MRRMMVSLPAWMLPLLLAACAAVTPPPEQAVEAVRFPAEQYRAAQQDGQRVYWLRPADSQLRIYVFRTGALARLAGHNHVITAERFRGAVTWPEGDPAQARLDLVVPVTGLKVDPAAVREELGGEFATRIEPEAAAGTRTNMRSTDVLAAERHGTVGVRLLAVEGALPRPILTLAVTLRGQTRQLTVPVAISVGDHRLLAEGRLVLRQSRFGITPFSALGGALRVADPVMVEFRLVGRTDMPPAPR